MYNLRRLAVVAREGLTDMAPAVRQAFNDDSSDDRLDQVYGSHPRLNVIALTTVGIVAGEMFARLTPDFELKGFVNWPAVVVGALFAVAFRRYLFGGGRAGLTDFPWLAASLMPAMVLLVIDSIVARFLPGSELHLAEFQTAESLIGPMLVALTDALGVAAALTIAVATLCFSRNWLKAIWDLAVRLLVFRIMVWVTALVLVEIGIVGPILAGLLEGIFGWRVPAWLPQLADELTYAALVSVAYLAIIGATWVVCRKSYGQLLETGETDILGEIAALARDPNKKKKIKKGDKK